MRSPLRLTPPVALGLGLALALGAAPANAQIRGPHEERVKEVKALGQKGDLASTKKIVGFLQDKHPFPRDEAFTQLIRLKDPKSIEWLATEAIAHENADVRADVIEACMLLDAKAAVPALVKLLGRDDRNRALVADALADLGGPGEAEPLAKAAKSGRDARARAAALEAAAKLDPARAEELAGAVGPEDDYPLRVAAIRALAKAAPARGVEAALAALEARAAAWEKKKDREKVGPWQPACQAMRSIVAVEDLAPHVDALKKAIDALIALMGHEAGRMKHETHLALAALTGKGDLAQDREQWHFWWEQNRAKWQPRAKAPAPPDGKRDRRPLRDGGKGAPPAPEPPPGEVGSTSVRFHGVPIFSDRVVFVIDLSGSMGDPMPVPANGGGEGGGGERLKMDVSKEELLKTVDAFEKSVHFNVIFLGTEVVTWQPRLVPATDQAKKQAHEFVSKQKILGRTNFYGALARALEDPEADTAYFLTDGGMTTEGKYIDQRRIVRKLMEIDRWSLVEINCLLFGTKSQQQEGSMSRRWLEALAAATGGKFYVRPEQ